MMAYRILTIPFLFVMAAALSSCGLLVDKTTKHEVQGPDNGGQGQVICPRSITVTWVASPSENVAGYNLYYGSTSGGPYPHKVDVGNSLTYTIKGACPGEYYIVATAYRPNEESAYSAQAAATVNPEWNKVVGANEGSSEQIPVWVGPEQKVVVPANESAREL